MTQKGQTPDERFLVKLYQLAMETGCPFNQVPCRKIAEAIGQKETAVKNIVKHLAQANFLKKSGDTVVYLTQNGCNFVLNELENR